MNIQKISFGNNANSNVFAQMGLQQIPEEQRVETTQKRADQGMKALGYSLAGGGIVGLVSGIIMSIKKVGNPIFKAIGAASVVALAGISILTVKDTVNNVKNFNENGKI